MSTTPSKPAPRSDAPASAGPRVPAWMLAALLSLLTAALYWPATQNGFVTLDDPEYVSSNVEVQKGLTWEGVQRAFTSVVSGNWHPVTMLSHMLDCQLFGMQPWGHHLTNVLLHALNTALVFLLLQQMTHARWRSLLVAALFAVHPLRVESVAWVAERKDVLSACFGLLTLIFYVRYVHAKIGHRPSAIRNYSLALLFFALGLMSKPMLVTWPCVLLLLDYWPLQRIFDFPFPISDLKRLLVEKIPFFILAAAASVAALVAQGQGGAVITVADYPMADRVSNAVISYWRYLEKTFWPTDLAVFYPHAANWPLSLALAAGAVLCGVTALVILGRRRWPFLLVGWLWFLGTLVPVIGLVQVGKQAIADRYTYIPSLGVLVLAVWGVEALTRRWRQQKLALAVASSTALVFCQAMTRQQIRYWKDSETLFRHTLEVTKDNFIIHYDLGVVLFDKGQTDAAMQQFQEAVRLAPAYADARVNLGVALLNQGQTGEAMVEFQDAVRLRPADANAHYNLGLALLGQGRLDEATSEFQETVHLEPNDGAARTQLARTLGLKQKLDSLASDPVALNNAAWELATSPDARIRNGALAVQLAERACEATHYRVTVVVGTLAAAYAEAGQFDAAVATGQKACALASELGETNLLKRNQELMTLYQAHRAYHEPAKTDSP